MSIHLTQSNATLRGSNAGHLRLDLPAGCLNKPANTGFVLGMWLRTLPQGAEDNKSKVVLARGGSGNGGSDAFFRFDPNDLTTLRVRVRNGGTDLAPNPVDVSTPGDGQTFLCLLIQTAANFHLVTCAPAGTPNVISNASTGLYGNSPDNRGGLFTRIGAASSATTFYGDMENLFFCHGLFPETGGAPDMALIQSIADGMQDIGSLAAQLTGGDLRCHFKMLRRNDYADATGNFGPITVGGIEDAAEGRFYYSGGVLRPGALRPVSVGHWVSPLTFTERDNVATATATIRAEGGTYHGITPAAIEARLMKEDGTAHIDWTVIDPSPSGGSWGTYDFANVAATPGFLGLEFRAVDGTGAQIGDIVASKGLRGTGFAFHSQQCQSQGMYIWVNNSGTGAPYDAGMRLVTVQIAGSLIETIHSTTNGASRNRGIGVGWLANEIHARFPGYPIQLGTVGQSGTSAVEWDTGGIYFGRWAELGAYYGIEQPDPHIMHLGHSEGPVSYQAYSDMLTNTVGHCEAALGTAAKVLIVPTPRYSGIGSTITHTRLNEMRDVMWDYAKATAKAYHFGSFAVVTTSESGTDPHPSGDSTGQGRTGSLIGLGMMAAQGAIAGPVEIKSKEASGTTVTLNLGPVNS